jgi:hypothetical protein
LILNSVRFHWVDCVRRKIARELVPKRCGVAGRPGSGFSSLFPDTHFTAMAYAVSVTVVTDHPRQTKIRAMSGQWIAQ